ncbi:MAG: RNA pseudouridine synthase, partial [Bacteroidetes bacterium]|nr:RNA pseudouridine synthase [Bacteroidota bacterium]
MMAHPKISQKFVHFQDLILFEDDHILVVDKPLYMASLDDKSNRNLNHLAKLYNPDLQLCHRLDKNTSGVLLMAKSPENYREISLQFQRRQIKKVYKTLVHGVHRFENQEVDLPLVVSTNKKVFVNRDNGKKSVTIFNTEEIFRNYTL